MSGQKALFQLCFVSLGYTLINISLAVLGLFTSNCEGAELSFFGVPSSRASRMPGV
jgi:hypothetical protein